MFLQDSRAVYEHVTSKYGVKFPIFKKIDVIGENTADHYTWLASKF